jgi:hypothetical protein
MTMMNTQVKKRSAADDESSPLRQAGILQQMLDYVGPGHWYFVSTVSKLRKDLYEKVASHRTAAYSYENGCFHFFTCICKMTLYSSIFASPARVGLAHDGGFHYHEEQDYVVQYQAGVHADQETLVTAHELGLQYSPHVLNGALRSGDLSKVMWLHTEQHCVLDPREGICQYAAISGSITVLDWLKQQGVTLDSSDFAAESGHMHVLQYLHAEGCGKGYHVCHWAARNGDLEMLKWAFEHGYPWFVGFTSDAAESHNIELMAWLIQQPGVQLNAEVMNSAVSVGDMAMCEFLLANQCPWNERTCRVAVEKRELDVLCWLREHGCPYDIDEVARAAADFNKVAVFVYMQQDGVVFTAEQLTRLLNSAGVTGSLAAAQWLRQQGAEWPAVLRIDSYFHRTWRVETLAWARAEGCISPEIDPGLWDQLVVRTYISTSGTLQSCTRVWRSCNSCV